MILLIANAVSGVSDAGFNMAAQPAASAAPTFLVYIAAGKFQGVIKNAIPIGCL